MRSQDMETTQMDIKAMEIKEIWQVFQDGKTTPLRNHLMEKYLPLVKYNAERIYAKLPDWKPATRRLEGYPY